MSEKAIFNWSGGKDSVFGLYHILLEKKFDVLALLTSVSQKYQRISMHGVRVSLLRQQAESIGLSLVIMEVPDTPSMEMYEKTMAEILTRLKSKGADVSIFGDIFLEDLRKYREDKLAELDIKAEFPLWKRPTLQLINEFIGLGFKTIVTCVNEKYLDKSFAGRIIDEQFLEDLPPGVDPCGENGEFHTFVFDGPLFKKPVEFTKGDIVYRKYEKPTQDNAPGSCNNNDPFDTGFFYCDLIPVNNE